MIFIYVYKVLGPAGNNAFYEYTNVCVCIVCIWNLHTLIKRIENILIVVVFVLLLFVLVGNKTVLVDVFCMWCQRFEPQSRDASNALPTDWPLWYHKHKLQIDPSSLSLSLDHRFRVPTYNSKTKRLEPTTTTLKQQKTYNNPTPQPRTESRIAWWCYGCGLGRSRSIKSKSKNSREIKSRALGCRRRRPSRRCNYWNSRGQIYSEIYLRVWSGQCWYYA